MGRKAGDGRRGTEGGGRKAGEMGRKAGEMGREAGDGMGEMGQRGMTEGGTGENARTEPIARTDPARQGVPGDLGSQPFLNLSPLISR